MRLTNKYNLPSSFVNAVSGLIYDPRESDPNRISITSLINNPLPKLLALKHWDEIEEDVSDHIWRIFGSAAHYVLAQIDKDKEKSKNHLIEQKIEETVNGIKVVGKLDLYDNSTKSVEDYKFTCLPLSAEALTKNGWKKYNELKIGENILTYDFEKDETIWSPLLKINFYENAKTLKLKSKSFEIECTPNHKWFIEQISNYKNKKYITKKIIETKNFKSNQNVITAAKCNNKKEIDISNEEAELIGWLITDGGMDWKNKRGAYICQSKEPYKTEIQNKFKYWFKSVSIRTKGWKNPIFIFRLDTNKIRNLFNKLNIVNKEDLLVLVSKMDSSGRVSMLNAMSKAEGYFLNGKLYNWCQKPGIVLDLFQILMTLEGKRLSLPVLNKGCYYFKPLRTRYLCTTSRKTGKPIFSDNEIKNQPVWCPTTKYNSWITRFNGIITITGNSIWSVKFGEHEEWEKQLNPYAWLLRKAGFEVNHLQINAILKDWRKSECLKYQDYPEIPFKVIPVKLWTFEEQQAYVEERVEIYKESLKMPIEEVPICSSKERWAKEDVYAVYKNNNKTASRLLETSEAAEEWANKNLSTKDTYRIDKRPGEDLKCVSYCSSAPYCSYWKERYGK